MTTEDAADRARDWAEEQGIPKDSVAFYHALIGDSKKCQLEFLLAAGVVRILFCTDAVGMVSQTILFITKLGQTAIGMRYGQHSMGCSLGSSTYILCFGSMSWTSWTRSYNSRGSNIDHSTECH